jgi:hypothetical protein
MLVLGSSDVIPADERLRLYASTAEMLSDGFSNTDPEYLAALLYFGQSPAPNHLWVGRQDTTVGSLLAFDINAGGTGYSEGDVLTVVQAGATSATLTVTAVDAGTGAVTEAEITTDGANHSVADGLATTVAPSGGTGCTIDATEVSPETILEALQACRAKNFSWYVCMACDAVKADHLLIAAWVETATPTSVYAFTTEDADVPLGTAENIFEQLKNDSYGRTIGQYSTDNPYAIAAIMGYAMGQNTGLANSAYTLKFKREVGVETESLTSTQITNIEENNGNLYLSYANYYNIFEQGKMANGQFFDEVINLDMLSNNIQLSVMDLLYQNPKIPQTDMGVTFIIHQINIACDQAVNLGFLAPGTWTGLPVLNLNTGDVLPKGYLVQAPAIASQAPADREARKSPPIYVAIKEAGAIHSVLIGVYVNR